MIPSEVTADDARPMLGEITVANCERFLFHRENATAAKNRNTFGARLKFVRCVTRGDALLVFRTEMRSVVNRRTSDSAVRMRWAAIGKEAPNDSAHSEQGRKAYKYNSAVSYCLEIARGQSMPYDGDPW